MRTCRQFVTSPRGNHNPRVGGSSPSSGSRESLGAPAGPYADRPSSARVPGLRSATAAVPSARLMIASPLARQVLRSLLGELAMKHPGGLSDFDQVAVRV